MNQPRAPWQVTRVLPLIAGESLDGYIARVAAAHHMPRMAKITEITGEIDSYRPHASFCDAIGLEILADCLRIDPDIIRLHAPQWSPNAKILNLFGIPILRDYLQFSYRRFSPKALSMSAHHRGLWQLRLLPVCTETWEYLEEHCPNPSCRRRQIWRRTAGIELCDYCAEPLERVNATPVPEHMRKNLGFLIDLIHHDPTQRMAARRHLSPQLTMLDGGQLLELACLLAPVIDRRVTPLLRFRSLCLDNTRKLIVPALAETWHFLAGWPDSIEQYVAEKLNLSGSKKGGSARKEFYRILSTPDDPRLSPAVRKVVSDIVDRSRAARSQGMTIAEAKRATGADRRTLFEMRKAGMLPSFLALDGIRLKVLVDNKAVASMIADNKPRIRLSHAAVILGIPTYGIREMVHLGFLTAARVPPGRGDYLQLAVWRDSLEAFRNELHSRLVETDVQHPLRLGELMQRIGARPKPWANVLEAIRSGKLSASLVDGTEPLAQRITVAADVSLHLKCFRPVRSMDWAGCMITKADLAEIMNIRAPHFGRHTEFLLGEGPYFREISMDAALRIARTYISTGEIRQRLGLHPRAASYLAQSHGVLPEAPGLFKRTRAERLIPGLRTN